MSERADETAIASFPSRATAALATGALRASGISAWTEPETREGNRILVWVRTQQAREAREVLAACDRTWH